MTTAITPITNPNVTRSRLVLEIASEMAGGAAADAVPDYVLPKVVLQHSRGGKPVTFSGVSSAEGIFAVVAREIDLAMINPAAVLSVALRGQGIFKKPMPVRAVAVIPSWDAFVFAVRPETGLTRFEDIAAQKPKLRILMRATPDHSLHHMFDDVAAAVGFSRHDIARWGGEVRKTGSVPWPYTETFKALIRGEVDAIFDEAAHSWVPQALDAGITILPLAEATVARLEAMGYRRAVLPTSAYPKLPHDVLSLDFSGWTVFVHAEADDALATRARRALHGKSPAICRSSAWRAKRSTRRNACRCIRPPSAFGAAAVIFDQGIINPQPMSAFGLLLGVKRTSRGVVAMSVFDSERSSIQQFCCDAQNSSYSIIVVGYGRRGEAHAP
jgi:hypothetical protein